MKMRLRDQICTTLFWLGISNPNRRSKSSLTVLTFHRVLLKSERAQYPYPELCVTPEELDALIQALKPYYEITSLTQAKAKHASRQEGKPMLALSFDDGQLDNYINALPILNKHRVQATFYIPVNAIEQQSLIWHDQMGFTVQALLKNNRLELHKTLTNLELIQAGDEISNFNDIAAAFKLLQPQRRLEIIEKLKRLSTETTPPWANMMTWDQIRQLHTDGHEIGSHSMSHHLLPQLSKHEQHYELLESYTRLNKEIGADVHSFCFPNGDYSETTISILEQSPYKNAVTTCMGTYSDKSHKYKIPRIDINPRTIVDRHGNFSSAHLFYRLWRNQ